MVGVVLVVVSVISWLPSTRGRFAPSSGGARPLITAVVPRPRRYLVIHPCGTTDGLDLLGFL